MAAGVPPVPPARALPLAAGGVGQQPGEVTDERRRRSAHRSLREPPEWPHEVAPPDTAGWEESAVRWMRTLLPPTWAEYDVFHHQPLLLARQAELHIQAEIAGLRHGWSTTRRELAEAGMDPRTIDETLEVYASEGRRLRILDRSLQLVTDALALAERKRPRSRR
jgi:hypothetical protein